MILTFFPGTEIDFLATNSVSFESHTISFLTDPNRIFMKKIVVFCLISDSGSLPILHTYMEVRAQKWLRFALPEFV